MNYKSLDSFLADQEDVVKVNDLLYKLTCSSVPCVGIIFRTSNGNKILFETIQVRPISVTMDIGMGAGCGKSFSFNYINKLWEV